MGLQPISMTGLRMRARDVLEGARFQGERYVIGRYGRPMAVLMGIEEYGQLTAFQDHGTVSYPPMFTTTRVQDHETIFLDHDSGVF